MESKYFLYSKLHHCYQLLLCHSLRRSERCSAKLRAASYSLQKTVSKLAVQSFTAVQEWDATEASCVHNSRVQKNKR